MKRTTDYEKLISCLRDPIFDRVLVACHRSPDGDAAGSAHALAYALRKMGRQAGVWCPDPFGTEFSYLFSEEESLPAFEPEHYVTVDVADPSMLCDAPFAGCIHAAVDHHRINRVEAEVKYVDPAAASCGEILVDVIRDLGVTLDSYLAEALYTAVATDTGCFRYSNTTEKTFLAAATLSAYAEKGAFYRINKAMFESKSRTRLKLEAYAAEQMGVLCEGKLAYLSVSLEKQEKLGAEYRELDTMINVMRQLEGVRVAIIAKEREEGVYKVSVRSEAEFDAAAFCAVFGGGGHVAAAGCTLEGREEDVLSALLKEAEGRLS
ncbi:MAG: DHH family phosphoesterase [Clostridia bacterium]|nr:DHH family phosphoesterase [Clostridia bacterium]